MNVHIVNRADMQRQTRRSLAVTLGETKDLDALRIHHAKQSSYHQWLVYLASYKEDFLALYRLNAFSGHILLIRDRDNAWYSGKKEAVLALVNEQIEKEAKRVEVTFCGQSMGGTFAALCGHAFHDSVALCFSPQTYNTRENPVFFATSIPVSETPLDFIDVREEIAGKPTTSRLYVLVAQEETQNLHRATDAFFWADMIHAGYLLGLPCVSIVVLPSNSHTLFADVDTNELFKVITEHWHKLLEGTGETHLKKVRCRGTALKNAYRL